MTNTLLLHPRTFLISKSGIIPAKLANNIEILGKNSQDEYSYKNIQRQSDEIVEAKTREILTERKLFNIYENYHVSSSKGLLSINQITEEHEILDIKNIRLEEIQNLLKSTANYPNSYKSYLCGFQNSLLAKFFHDEEYMPKSDDVYYHDSSFFLELENGKLLGISEKQDDNGLLKKIILWHKRSEITNNFSKIYEKIYKDMSYISSGIIIRCIPKELTSDLHTLDTEFVNSVKQSTDVDLNEDSLTKNVVQFMSEKLITPLLPRYVTEFSNIQFFLVGFLTGMVWDGRRVDYNDTFDGTRHLDWSRGKKRDTNRKMITTKPIKLYMKKGYFLPKMLPPFLSVYDMNYEYRYNKENGEIEMLIYLTNMPNLLNNKLGNTDYRKFSKVLHIADHDKSNLIKFNIDVKDDVFLPWRPILDFTLVEID